MTTNFTPGPWEILEVTPDDWQINSDLRDDCLVQMTPTIGHEHLSDEDKANARLIAAAPDMHALLTMAVARIELEDAPPMLAAWAEDARQLLERMK